MTIAGIVEDSEGVVIGAVMEDGSCIMLTREEQVPRSQLATAARTLATRYGVTLPENPAIPPA
jgi:hypothetical protein